MPSGSKFLLILVALIFIGGIGFYSLLPHYMKTHRSEEEQAIDRTMEDVERAKKLVAIAVYENAPAAADGRVDVYKTLLATITDEAELVSLCSRLGSGPSIAEIRAGDYTKFPYQRAKGSASIENVGRPVFWDREPSEKGSRLVALSDCAVFVIPEAKFQAAMEAQGIQ